MDTMTTYTVTLTSNQFNFVWAVMQNLHHSRQVTTASMQTLDPLDRLPDSVMFACEQATVDRSFDPTNG
jgi:hypothetical protein